MEELSSTKIYKTFCENCHKNTFAFDYIPACLLCLQMPSETSSPLDNPIESFIKPKSLIITKSFSALNPLNYKSYDILHIGISNSNCMIYNFWGSYKKEAQNDNKIWGNVVNVILDAATHLNDQEFDALLEEDFKIQRINNSNYDQIENNCYSYVIRFFNSINYAMTQWSKEALALNMLQSKMSLLEKYCQLFQKLSHEKNAVICEDIGTGNLNIVYSVCDNCEEALFGVRKRCLVCQDFDLCEKCFEKIGHEHEMKQI